jgi:hypothetical protein
MWLLFFLVFGGVGSPALAADVQGLWAKAVQQLESSKHWIPGSVHTVIQETDSEGQALSQEVLQVVTVPEVPNSIRRQLLSARKDGEDVLASRKERVEGVRSKEDHRTHRENQDIKGNPFAQVSQTGMTVRDLNEVRKKEEKNWIKVGFVRTEKRKELYRGWAWLDSETGAPMEVEVEMLDRQWMVKSFVTHIHFGKIGDGGWGATRMSVKGHGGMLGMRRYFQTELTLTKHWLYTPGS